MSATIEGYAPKEEQPKRPPEKLTKGEKFGLIGLGVLALLMYSAKFVQSYIDQQLIDEIKPQMQVLADQGKPEAVIWIAKNNKVDDQAVYDKIKLAAEQGHIESMYLYGKYLGYKKDADGSEAWIKKAAAEGFPEAVRAQLKPE